MCVCVCVGGGGGGGGLSICVCHLEEGLVRLLVALTWEYGECMYKIRNTSDVLQHKWRASWSD